MRSIAGIRVGSTIGDKSNGGRKNKDVVQGSTEEGSRFLKKLRIFLGCMLWSSKGEASSRNKINQAHGENATNDVDEQQAIAQRSSSNTRSSSYATWCVPDQELFEASLLLRRFTFHDLMLATRTFKVENFHDEEGFGILLKGWINPYGNYAARPGTGIPVAVRTFNLNEFQHHKEWLDEIIYLSQLHHLNVVKLVGFCLEDDKRVLVYEHICEGSLEKHLFKSVAMEDYNEDSKVQKVMELPPYTNIKQICGFLDLRGAVHLTWPTRMKIAIGAANGMSFLHEEASRPLIFRDFKTSSILLDKDYNTKLWDFGLAKDAPVGHEIHETTKVVGSKGYEAPEYMMTGHLTSKSNVYSFGLVLLELLTGRRAVDQTMPTEEQNLIEWLGPRLRNKANFHYLMDPRLEGQYPTKFAHKTMRLAIHCLRLDPKTRPLMSEVARELKCLHDDMVGASTSAPSTSFGRMHISPFNHVGACKYDLGIGSSSNFRRCFQPFPQCQDYPLPLPPSPQNPRVTSSSNPKLELHPT